MVGSKINDIKTMLSDIEKKLNAIQEENDENIQELINYSTSTELCVGGTLCRYGELYKLVFKAESYDDIIPKLENLFYKDKFENYEELIEEIQRTFIEGLRTGLRFENIQEEICFKIEDEYIFDVILNSL